ncbi:sugar phosphate isomerase/epimerase [bacterium]|nr:sugar phosphate isomerase/epimerase [bacterium]
MKFGLNALLYTAEFSNDTLDLIPRVADLGFDGIEIPFISLDIIDPVATRRALEAAGLGATGCAVMMQGTNLISDDPGERQAGVARLEQCVAIAAEMGAEAVAGPIYSPVGLMTGRGRTDEEWDRAVDGLRTAAECASDAGIFLAVEPLNRFETYFVNTAADAVALIDAVDHPALKIQLDTFHANIEEKNTANAIRACGPRLGHFHASESDRGTPGTGQVAWVSTFAALDDIGYDAWVTIESFARDIQELCAAAAIWRDIYDDAESFARNGLAFLRRTAGVA